MRLHTVNKMVWAALLLTVFRALAKEKHGEKRRMFRAGKAPAVSKAKPAVRNGRPAHGKAVHKV